MIVNINLIKRVYMFSFVKFLQNAFDKLRKNKGLWFSTITFVALAGILFSIFVITSMTSSVSKKVYKTMSNDYKLKSSIFENLQLDQFKKDVITYTDNQAVLNVIEQGNLSEIKKIEDRVNAKFKKKGINNYFIKLYSVKDKKTIFRTSITSVMNSKNIVSGYEVMSDGVYSVYLYPLIKNDTVYGVIEIKESIHSYKRSFESLDESYVFLLDKKMLTKIGIEAKNQKYNDVVKDYVVQRLVYDTKFAGTIENMDKLKVESFLDKGYVLDGLYYRTYKPIIDVNGVNIGIMVMGELIDTKGGFVNLADDMTKTVTTVALGLVISILLFMF